MTTKSANSFHFFTLAFCTVEVCYLVMKQGSAHTYSHVDKCQTSGLSFSVFDPRIVRTLHRFAAENSRNQLPVWVRPSVKVYDKFGLALKDLMVFFKTAEKTVWKVFVVYTII